MKIIWYWHVLIFGIILNYLLMFHFFETKFLFDVIWISFTTPVLLYCDLRFFGIKSFKPKPAGDYSLNHKMCNSLINQYSEEPNPNNWEYESEHPDFPKWKKKISKPEMRKRVAIYVRVSTGKQEVENQLLQLRTYCDKCNYEIFKEYIDTISGKENSRPSYDVMFKDAHKRLFDLVLFWDLSRFSRAGTLFTLQKLKELENLGINWESYQEPYFKSAGQFKDVVLSILATLAKIEREKISERTKAGLERSRKKHLIGKRGKDKHPRKIRSDRGLKRGVKKSSVKSQKNSIEKEVRL